MCIEFPTCYLLCKRVENNNVHLSLHKEPLEGYTWKTNKIGYLWMLEFDYELSRLERYIVWFLSDISTYMYAYVYVISHVWLTGTPRTVAHQSPLSKGFPRQEYWSGFSFPPPRDLPNPGIKPESPVSPALQVGALVQSQGKPHKYIYCSVTLQKHFSKSPHFYRLSPLLHQYSI